MAYTTIANLKGPKGDQGPQGLAGVNGVANDTATGSYVGNPTSATRTALDAWVDGEVGNRLVGGVQTRNVTAFGLAHWTTSSILSQLGQQTPRILCVGDSTTAGVYSDSFGLAAGTTNQGGPNSWPHQLTRFLTTGGYPAVPSLAIPGRANNDDSRWNKGSWNYVAGVAMGAGGAGNLSAAAAGAPIVLTPGVAFNRAVVYYFGDTGTGTMTVTITGGSAVAVDTANATAKIHKSAEASTVTASASNTVTINRTAGTVFVVGVEFYTTGSTVRVMNAGVGSSQAVTWGSNGDTAKWGGVALINAIKPTLLIVSLGVNDAAAGTPVATAWTGIKALLDAQTTQWGSALLVSGVPHSSPTTIDAYNDHFKKQGYPYVDLAARYGYDMKNMGLQTGDNVHPNAQGYGDMARVISRALIDV